MSRKSQRNSEVGDSQVHESTDVQRVCFLPLERHHEASWFGTKADGMKWKPTKAKSCQR